MPKKKVEITDEIYPIAKYTNFKVYTTDSINDYKVILQQLFFFHKNSISSAYRDNLASKISEMNLLPNYPLEHDTRVYITAAIDQIMLFMLDTPTNVIDNMIKIISYSTVDDTDLLRDASCLFPYIFIFKDSSLLFSSPIYPQQHAELMAVFAKYNLVEFSPTRRYYFRNTRK